MLKSGSMSSALVPLSRDRKLSSVMRFLPPIYCALLVAAMVSPARSAAPIKPNIVLIVADDLGWADLGCYGAMKIKTPIIDRLAEQGVRFTDAHSTAATCQRSRYTLLTGAYLYKHFDKAKHAGPGALLFHDEQATIPSVLKQGGYRTAAFGKWQLGFGRNAELDYNRPLEPGPLEIGFDRYFGTPRTHCEPPFVYVEDHHIVGLDPEDPLRMVASGAGFGFGMSTGATKAHLARQRSQIDIVVAEKACEWIVRQPPDSPIFVYLPFLAPHVPLWPSPEFRGRSEAGLYGDCVEQFDACVGKVLAALEQQGRTDQTLLVVTSDNGALHNRHAFLAGHRSNGNLLGQKTDVWEGGHRVPLIACWPGRIPAGTQCARLFSLADCMATFVAAAGLQLPPGAGPESISQLAVLTDPTHPARRREMVYVGTRGFALRSDEHVYLSGKGSLGFTVANPPWPKTWGVPWSWQGMNNSDIMADGTVKPAAPDEQLYNLADDLSQTTNLARSNPERTAALKRRLAELLEVP